MRWFNLFQRKNNTRFDILRSLHMRIAAKPEQLIDLTFWESETVECGTPHCVLGELFSMPEMTSNGFLLRRERSVNSGVNFAPRPFLGSLRIYPLGKFSPLERFLGITHAESVLLFNERKVSDGVGTDRDVALRRIEQVFKNHNEELATLEVEDAPRRVENVVKEREIS